MGQDERGDSRGLWCGWLSPDTAVDCRGDLLVAGIQLQKGYMIKCFILHFAQKNGSGISLVLFTFHKLERSEPVVLHSGCATVATS